MQRQVKELYKKIETNYEIIDREHEMDIMGCMPTDYLEPLFRENNEYMDKIAQIRGFKNWAEYMYNEYEYTRFEKERR